MNKLKKYQLPTHSTMSTLHDVTVFNYSLTFETEPGSHLLLLDVPVLKGAGT